MGTIEIRQVQRTILHSEMIKLAFLSRLETFNT